MPADYDVLIAGSGLSAYLLALELSSLRVAVLESSPDRRPRRFCLVDEAVLQENIAIARLVGNNGRTGARDGRRYRVYDREALLRQLREQALKHGCTICCPAHFLGALCEREYISIRTSSDSYRARLLADCMGSASPLLFRLQMARVTGFQLIYSRLVRGRASLLRRRAIGSRIFETLPSGPDVSQEVLIVNARDLRKSSNVEKDLALGLEPDQEAITPPRGGIVPLIRVRRRIHGRVVAVDSADDDASFGSIDSSTRAIEGRHATASLLRTRLAHLT